VCNISRRPLASCRQVPSPGDLRLMSAQWLLGIVHPTLSATSCTMQSTDMDMLLGSGMKQRSCASCPVLYSTAYSLPSAERKRKTSSIRSQIFAVTMHAPCTSNMKDAKAQEMESIASAIFLEAEESKSRYAPSTTTKGTARTGAKISAVTTPVIRRATFCKQSGRALNTLSCTRRLRLTGTFGHAGRCYYMQSPLPSPAQTVRVFVAKSGCVFHGWLPLQTPGGAPASREPDSDRLAYSVIQRPYLHGERYV
jgi:hypothetical protein